MLNQHCTVNIVIKVYDKITLMLFFQLPTICLPVALTLSGITMPPLFLDGRTHQDPWMCLLA